MKTTMLLVRMETRLMFADPFPILLLIAIPLVLVAFLAEGLGGGPVHSIPGLAGMFGLFGLAVVGLSFFRDHGWGTWDRLRSSRANPAQILLAKAVPLAVLFAVQQVVILLFGWAVFDMPWEGSLAAGALLVVTIAAVEVALGLVLVTICSTIDQNAVLSYMGALLLAGFGGALTPLSSLPDWANTIAPVSPVYWMLKGYEVVIEGVRPTSDIVEPILVLLAFLVGSLAVVALRWRTDAAKTYFAA